MKRFLFFTLTIAVLVILTGCADSPKKVAEKWREALIKGDINMANNLSTERTYMANAYIHAMLANESESDFSKTFKDAIYDVQTISGEKATVGSSKNNITEIKLVKRNGKWLIDADKNL